MKVSSIPELSIRYSRLFFETILEDLIIEKCYYFKIIGKKREMPQMKSPENKDNV